MTPLPPTSVNLGLVSHTNAGKTTLVRTLLRQDVGEVRDEAHVTMAATGYPMLTADGDALMLWDTPGFGDTGRLLKRLRLSGNPIGWFLSQVWDRFRDKPFYASQQAVRAARDQADVILYLVNASEDPQDAGYVPLEMEILAWLGKPVLLLLNQTGPPSETNAAEETRWREHLSAWPHIRGALTLDAFARCWVQEGRLLNQVIPLLDDPDRRATMERLARAWEAQSLGRFHAAMGVLARALAAAAADREPIGERRFGDRVRGAIAAVRGDGASPEEQRAMRVLTDRLDASIRTTTEQLLELHGLSGRATGEVLKRIEKAYASTAPAREGIAAVLGGLVSGAATGIAADIAAGGLTLGGGMLVGGLLGAAGAFGLARGVNIVGGGGEPAMRWDEGFFAGLVRSSLLRYLAVAHFGRGRGDWAEGEHPVHWQAAVEAEVEAHRAEVRRLWGRAADGADAAAEGLERLLKGCAARLLVRLYPEAAPMLAADALQPAEQRQHDQRQDG